MQCVGRAMKGEGITFGVGKWAERGSRRAMGKTNTTQVSWLHKWKCHSEVHYIFILILKEEIEELGVMVNTSNPSTSQHRRITGSKPALGYKISSKPRLQDGTRLKKQKTKTTKQTKTQTQMSKLNQAEIKQKCIASLLSRMHRPFPRICPW